MNENEVVTADVKLLFKLGIFCNTTHFFLQKYNLIVFCMQCKQYPVVFLPVEL